MEYNDVKYLRKLPDDVKVACYTGRLFYLVPDYGSFVAQKACICRGRIQEHTCMWHFVAL